MVNKLSRDCLFHDRMNLQRVMQRNLLNDSNIPRADLILHEWLHVAAKRFLDQTQHHLGPSAPLLRIGHQYLVFFFQVGFANGLEGGLKNLLFPFRDGIYEKVRDPKSGLEDGVFQIWHIFINIDRALD
ncbi:MAG: hypothetical protein M1377_06960 [Deltaproteobacteria bacterium]|nr:hypothetical protein [Deltaproteobacteria bacterium]